MRRLIDANALIAEYDRVHIGEPGKARQLILDAPTIEPGPQWIPCSVRLPDESEYYLTSTDKGEVFCDYWDTIDFDQWDNVGHEDRLKRIIAWMPLPKPYEEVRLKDGKA